MYFLIKTSPQHKSLPFWCSCKLTDSEWVGFFEEREMGKGSKRRPSFTTREEQDLRNKYAESRIIFDEFEKQYKKLMREGKIKRNGRVVKDV